MTLLTTVRRHENAIRWVSAAVLVAAAFLLMRLLPVNQAIARVEGTVKDLGAWGPVVFGGAYVVAGLLLVPGAALTIAAGALFGLLWGTITVSISSTLVAGLAFLAARTLARARVERLARENSKFGAIDEAIRVGGWKIVALLRLSPVVPFSLGNYLYGLTPVRFGPYLLSSWLTMLPGTFLYVYIGHAGAQGLAAAAGGSKGRSPMEWVMMGIGFLATVVVTIYVTLLASQAVKARTRLGMAPASPPDPAVRPVPTTTPWGTLALAGAALLAASTAGCAWSRPQWVSGLFGPPAVESREEYAAKPGGPTFDHSRFDALLRKHVSEGGWVDYDGLAREAADLDAYVSSLGTAPFDSMDRDERLALLLNAYNAFTLRLILDHRPLASIRDIPSAERWDAVRWNLGGHTWSLNQIEQEQIRPRFAEPRIHFALVCAAFGCPPLRAEAYRADRLDAQLEEQAVYVHTHDRWFLFDLATGPLHLTRLYDWYGGDFTQAAGSVPAFAARYSPALKAVLDAGRTPSVEWLDYDWKLNSLENRR